MAGHSIVDNARLVHRMAVIASDGRAMPLRLSRFGIRPNTANGRTAYMTGLKVSPQQLSTLGGSCSRTATDIRGQQVSLKGQLTPLFGADWSGAAATQS